MVITIDTGYQNRPSWLWRTTCLSQDHMPIVFYDRPAIRAEARIFFVLLVSSAPPIRQGYPRCAILQQGMHLNVFSKVYYDRVYFSCAERIMTGSGFDPPPPQRHPPIHLRSRVPPTPGALSFRKMVFECLYTHGTTTGWRTSLDWCTIPYTSQPSTGVVKSVDDLTSVDL